MSTDTQFGSWSIAESPLQIDYSLVAIEEIRNAVADGYQKFARGGIEVGGILYGTVTGTTVRIQATREIACEHALGPAFLLSEKDLAAFQEQLRNGHLTPGLENLAVVGWYVSHTRSDIGLTDSEAEIFDRSFIAPWQVTMVVRPGKAGSMRAGFFVREPDGSLKRDRSYLEFDFPERPTVNLYRPSRERVREPRASALPPDTAQSQIPVEQRTTEPEVEPIRAYSSTFLGGEAYAAPKKNWAWMIVAALVIATTAVAVIGIRFLGPQLSRNNDPLALSVFERDGQLRIQWNRFSQTVKQASSARLLIKDGSDARDLHLGLNDLSTGSFTYVRKTGDVQVRLSVESSSGARTEEASTFLGTAPITPAGAATDSDSADSGKDRSVNKDNPDAKKNGDASVEEFSRLRRENEKQAERIRQLERTLVILRSRLGIEEPAQ